HGALRIRGRRRRNVLDDRGKARLGGDAAPNGFRGVGHAASATAGYVDRQVTTGIDGERGVRRPLVDLTACRGVVADLGDGQVVLGPDRVDDLLGSGDGDGHVVQCRPGE